MTSTLLAVAALGFFQAPTPDRPLILAHVMPWFESKPISGSWGWHWSMNHFDPDKIGPDGRRAIASHLYPLIGPYDSADPDVLEYHTLLMRIAGIDGVIADWYGHDTLHDYPVIHHRTEMLFEATRKRGLKFAVCYEDRVLKAAVEVGKLRAENAAERAHAHLQFCEKVWFPDPSYLRWQGKPLLLAFGPDYLQPQQWQTALNGLRPEPFFLTLHERRPPAVGSFAWPPMWASKNGTLNEKDLDAYLDRFSQQKGLKISAAFPGFHDIYKEAGNQPSYGFLDARDGATFRHTLDRALAAGTPFVQIATWNDFGEGTCVEPTREFEYRDLEILQQARRKLPGLPFPYQPGDLRQPLRVFELRKQGKLSDTDQKSLDAAVANLFAGRTREATQRLDELAK